MIKRGNKIIGFECECGFRHIQRRPIVAGAPALGIKSQKLQKYELDKLTPYTRAK
jgi:hypothetical protein